MYSGRLLPALNLAVKLLLLALLAYAMTRLELDYLRGKAITARVLDLYNSVIWFDDVAHSITWMFLVLAVGSLILRLELEPWITAALSIGFGAVSHILWEIIEFVAMWIGSPGLQLTYEDTISDLAMSLGGTLIAGLVTGSRAESARSAEPVRHS